MSEHMEIALLLMHKGCDCHVLREAIPPGHVILMPLVQDAANDPCFGAAA